MNGIRAVRFCTVASSLGVSLARVAASDEACAAEPAAVVPIHVDTNSENLEILDRSDQTTVVPVKFGRYGSGLARKYLFAPVCAQSPCDATIAQGTHVLAVARPEGSLVVDDAAVSIPGPSNVHAEFVDRSALRTAGLAFLGGSLLGAAAFFFVGREGPRTCNADGRCTSAGPDVGLLLASFGVLLGGTIASLILLGQHDVVSFSVTPLTLGAPREGGRAAATSIVANAFPNALALTMRF